MTTICFKNGQLAGDKCRTGTSRPPYEVRTQWQVTKVSNIQNTYVGKAGIGQVNDYVDYLYVYEGFMQDLAWIKKQIESIFWTILTLKLIPMNEIVSQWFEIKGQTVKLHQLSFAVDAQGTVRLAHDIESMKSETGSIGSGSQVANDVLLRGGSVEIAITMASLFDQHTGRGIDMADKQQEKVTEVLTKVSLGNAVLPAASAFLPTAKAKLEENDSIMPFSDVDTITHKIYPECPNVERTFW
ncbi:hypothetical protein [Vibrio metoecus]|uniref:hypothetical protein n=1 Tax=Vibrio metoecus TaxID=1481663 RepID=UPI000BA98F86|nr:hypothetical protein [Vibrio metoecus]PAR45406.1 hypothetical protein CGT95_15490 [Vibrio metoecus]